jgi:hypothetical protein
MAVIKVGGLKESDGIVFKTMKAGNYPVRIVGIEDAPSKKGNPMLTFKLKVSSGEHMDELLAAYVNLPYEGMEPSRVTKCVAQLKRLIVACGMGVTDDTFDTQDLMGAEFLAEVTEEQMPSRTLEDGTVQKGKPSNNVKDYLPLK